MYRFVRFFAAPIVSLRHPTTIINKENFIEGPSIVCCNHYDSSDVLVIAAKLMKKDLNVLAKAELFKGKISSWFLTEIGAIKVNRGTPEVSVHKEILKRLKNGKQLLIFPEGTRNRAGGHDMAEFKNGAALYAVKAKVPIIPLMFHHQSKPFKRNYLIVGEKIDLSEFYGKNMHDVKDDISLYLHDKMEALHLELDQKVAELTAPKQK